EESAQQSAAMGWRADDAALATRLGEAYLEAGRVAEAAGAADRALTLAVEQQRRGHEGWALHLLGAMAARRDPPDAEAAAAHYRRALDRAEELGMRPLAAHCHRGLAALQRR